MVKSRQLFLQKNSIVDLRLGSKYAPESIISHFTVFNNDEGHTLIIRLEQNKKFPRLSHPII